MKKVLLLLVMIIMAVSITVYADTEYINPVSELPYYIIWKDSVTGGITLIEYETNDVFVKYTGDYYWTWIKSGITVKVKEYRQVKENNKHVWSPNYEGYAYLTGADRQIATVNILSSNITLVDEEGYIIYQAKETKIKYPINNNVYDEFPKSLLYVNTDEAVSEGVLKFYYKKGNEWVIYNNIVFDILQSLSSSQWLNIPDEELIYVPGRVKVELFWWPGDGTEVLKDKIEFDINVSGDSIFEMQGFYHRQYMYTPPTIYVSKYNYPAVDIYLRANNEEKLMMSYTNEDIIKNTFTIRVKYCQVGENTVVVKNRDSGEVVEERTFLLQMGSDGELNKNPLEVVGDYEKENLNGFDPLGPETWFGPLKNAMLKISSPILGVTNILGTWLNWLPYEIIMLIMFGITILIFLRIAGR